MSNQLVRITHVNQNNSTEDMIIDMRFVAWLSLTRNTVQLSPAGHFSLTPESFAALLAAMERKQ